MDYEQKSQTPGYRHFNVTFQPYPKYVCSEELVQLEGDDFDDGHDDELEGASLAEDSPERDEDRGRREVSSQQPGMTTTTQLITIIIIKTIICKALYIRKKFRSEAHKKHCNTHIFKIFIISLNLHIKTKC